MANNVIFMKGRRETRLSLQYWYLIKQTDDGIYEIIKPCINKFSEVVELKKWRAIKMDNIYISGFMKTPLKNSTPITPISPWFN